MSKKHVGAKLYSRLFNKLFFPSLYGIILGLVVGLIGYSLDNRYLGVAGLTVFVFSVACVSVLIVAAYVCTRGKTVKFHDMEKLRKDIDNT